MAFDADHFDLIVIGSGAAAASCWSTAARMGKRVAVVEAEALGGECPNFACMPTKALLHCAGVYEAAVGAGKFGIEIGSVSLDYRGVKTWKDAVLSRTGAALGEQPYRNMGVVVIRGRARFVSPDAVEASGRVYKAEHFLVATGASPHRPQIAGLREAGYLTFREAIDLTALPSSVLVLGGGPVGCEFSYLLSAFGSRIVLVDRNPRLVHREDAEVGTFLAEHFRRRGVDVRLNTGVARVERVAQGARVTLSPGDERITVERILVATGKTPNTDLGLEVAGLEYNQDGIVVDETLRTTNPHVHAAGDVIGPYRFTHAAAYQGRLACDNMFGVRRRRADYSAMPRCVFTSPEVATVGLTEQEAHDKGMAVRIGQARMHENDRAIITGREEGFVKVIADRTGRLLGGAIVADRGGELAQELALAISLGATASQLAESIHAFPTYSDALVSACRAIEESTLPSTPHTT
jgi:pyruvate/2-oxoglutarate dehydrogenase complex dihydrolipoamide dehydrogenase (E3) component